MSRWTGSLAMALLLALAVGCTRPAMPRSAIRLAVQNPAPTQADKTAPPATSPELMPMPALSGNSPAVTINDEVGAIAGQVRWDGPLDPAAAPARLRIDPATKGIADAVVWLVGVPVLAPAPAQREIQLVQRDGQFLPRVQAVLPGTMLKLRSADEKAIFDATGAAEFSCPVTRGKEQQRLLKQTGLVEVRSDLNPAASAHIWVFGDPYFAVTDSEGRFRLPEVPPGKYELVLWHEGWRGASTASPAVRKRREVQLDQGRGAFVQWPLNAGDAVK